MKQDTKNNFTGGASTTDDLSREASRRKRSGWK